MLSIYKNNPTYMIKQIFNNREEYFEYQALNYSTLKAFDTDPSSILNTEKKQTDALTRGSAIDTLLFDGIDEYTKQYYVMGCKKPTESSLIIADELIRRYKASGEPITDELFLSVSSELGLWGSIKDPVKRLAKFTDDIRTYLRILQESEGREILDIEQDTLYKNTVLQLKTNPFTNKFYVDTDITENLFQVAFSFEFEGELFKVMLDTVHINHEHKFIIPCDTKTMEESPLLFNKNIKKFRYDLQDELYTKGIEIWAKKYYPNYTIYPFMFCVVSLTQIDRPFVYRIKDVNKWRDRNNITGFPMKSVWQIVERFKKQREFQNFIYPYEIFTEGCIDL